MLSELIDTRHRLAWPDAAHQARVLDLAARAGLPVVVHAEHPEILARAADGVRALDPADAATHNAARPAMAEALAVAQLLTLNMAAGARLHIAHVTSAETVDMLRRFAGTSDFSAETCPHYLHYTAKDVARAGDCAKINPPVRHEADREALWQALADGTIQHVTTDHAAFSAAEKAAHEGNFLTAPPGHPGTEASRSGSRGLCCSSPADPQRRVTGRPAAHSLKLHSAFLKSPLSSGARPRKVPRSS